MTLTVEQVNRVAQLEADGRLTAEQVLEDAKAPESPLHMLYDWDVQRAAEAHWLDVSREIIRSVHLTAVIEDVSVRAPFYVKDEAAGHQRPGYVAVTTLRRTPDAAREALLAEFERVAGGLRRATALAAMLGLQDEVEGLLVRVLGLRASLLVPVGEEDVASPPATH
jgi:hypothetical protein